MAPTNFHDIVPCKYGHFWAGKRLIFCSCSNLFALKNDILIFLRECPVWFFGGCFAWNCNFDGSVNSLLLRALKNSFTATLEFKAKVQLGTCRMLWPVPASPLPRAVGKSSGLQNLQEYNSIFGAPKFFELGRFNTW